MISIRNILLIISSCILAIIAYNNSSYHLKKYRWKYNGSEEAGYMGDFMWFRTENEIGNRILEWPAIYRYDNRGNKKKDGYVVFCLYDRLWVYSLRPKAQHGFSEYAGK